MIGDTPGLQIHDVPGGFRLIGQIDAACAPALAARLEPLLGGNGDVGVNLWDVGFIDSSGLRALIEAHQRAEQLGRRVVMQQPSPAVRRLFDITGLAPYLHVISTDG